MKKQFLRIGAFTLTALLTIQLLSPARGVFADIDTSGEETGDSFMNDYTTYSAYDLSAVDITDTYLTNAEDKEIAYLLSLDADRLLVGFRETAGIDTKGARRYAGWETSLIAGHTLGHYLTATAQAIATLPASDAREAQLKNKLNTLITGLKECQEKTGTGFLFGATVLNRNNIEFQFDNVEGNKTNITTEAWVPWYTMHKILAGVIDVYKYTGNETALEIAKDLGTWVYNRTQTWSASVRRTVLNIEYGGMNDCLYELYELTGNDRYAIAAHAFDDENLFASVGRGTANILNNKHANTTIPKFLGSLNRYTATHQKTIDGELVNSAAYLTYAQNFFHMVLNRHTYVTGDNSEWEHFGMDNILDAERTNCNCETCNAYNMLKLAKELFLATGDVEYLQYYENTFYNTILSSQNPDTGMTTYFQPMASGYFKVYTTATNSFWCCTGSGMENFTKLGNAVYYSGKDTIVISQYLSSVLTDREKNVKLTMTADIPNSDTVTVQVATLDGTKNVKDSLSFRLPDWLAHPAVIKVNNAVISAGEQDGFAVVSGLKNGDTVSITLPMNITVHGLPDNDSVYAFKYGPIVLSAKLGTKDMTTTYTGVSVLIPAAKLIDEAYISDGTETISVTNGSVAEFMANINENLVKTEGRPEWTLNNTDANLTFVPHYSQHKERYGIYFTYESDADAFNANRYINEKEDARFHAALLDTVQPGYGQYENDDLHNMRENGKGSTGATGDGTSRYANAGGSFTYSMKIDPNTANCLELTLKKADNSKPLKILIGDEVIYDEVLSYSGSDEEYTLRIPIAKETLQKHAKYNGAYKSYVADFTFTGTDSKNSARICNYLYTLKAYKTNTGMTFSASAGTWREDGNTCYVEVPAEVNSLTLTVLPEDTYGYVRVNGAVAKDTRKVDLTNANFVTLYYKVFAEDHETFAEYVVHISQPVGDRSDVNYELAYFVNCGDYDVTTLPSGEAFGIYNGVTEQVYGTDPVTGKKWGLVDTVSSPLKNGTANNAKMTNAVFTDNTWPYETDATVTDTSSKLATSRYTKNQYENGMARNLNYSFELPDGEYLVELYFTDPWSCSKNPIVAAEEKTLLTNAAVHSKVTAAVSVTDGELNLNITAPNSTLCINLCYIKIYLPQELVVTPTPVPTVVPHETLYPTQEATPTTVPDNTPDDSNTNSKGKLSPVVTGVGISTAVAIAGAAAFWFFKKRRDAERDVTDVD